MAPALSRVTLLRQGHLAAGTIALLSGRVGFLVALGHLCRTWALPSGEWGLLFVVVHGLLIAVAYFGMGNGAQALGLQ